jgi:Dolichyl-phosphate-mannose-protein mannosyltransferase
MKYWWLWLAGEQSAMTETKRQQTCLSGVAGETATISIPNELSLNRLLGLFILVGVLTRAIRYYLCFPLWDDESFLCVNFIDRSFADLLQPLDFHQVAPVLFLWSEQASVKLFGFSEYSLRLIPFICSIVSLFLFRRVAQQLLSGPSLLFAVALFAVSYPQIRYAAEAKPYGTDMFLSLVMLSLIVEWHQSRNPRFLMALAWLMPIALGASYPAVFAAGGLSLVAGSVLLRQKGTAAEWRAWIIWNVMTVISFVVWFGLVGRVQSGAEGEFMGQYWKQNFPPVRQPWLLPYWLLKTHASDFLAYPLGGPNWASTLTLCLCFAGLWRLIGRKQFLWLGLLLGPVSLHFLAAALQKYPYGGHVKFSQYVAPMICCLIAVGIAQVLDWRSRYGYSMKHSFAWACSILLVVGLGGVVRDLINPYKTRSDDRARAFARSFWVGTHFAEEVACLKKGQDFVPEQHRELSWSAHFLCNYAIEVGRSHLRSADLTRVSMTRPLRFVLYRDARYELDQAKLDSWLDEMKQRFELVAHESIPFPRLAKNDRRLVTMEYIDSYKFVPRDGMPSELPPMADGRQTLSR